MTLLPFFFFQQNMTTFYFVDSRSSFLNRSFSSLSVQEFEWIRDDKDGYVVGLHILDSGNVPIRIRFTDLFRTKKEAHDHLLLVMDQITEPAHILPTLDMTSFML